MKCDLATFEQDKEDYITRGKYLFEGGITNYKAFGERLIKEFGNGIKPHVETIWQEVQDTHAAAIRQARYSPESEEALRAATKEIGFKGYEERVGPTRTEETVIKDARKEGILVDLAKRGKIPNTSILNDSQVRALGSEMDRIARLGWDEISVNPRLKEDFINMVLTVQASGSRAWHHLGAELQRVVSPDSANLLLRINRLSADERLQKAIDRMIKDQEMEKADWDKLAEWARNVKLASTSSLIRSVIGNTTAQVLRLVNTPVSAFYNKILHGLTGVKQDRFAKEAAIELMGTVKNLNKSVETIVGLWHEDPATIANNPFYQNEGFRLKGAIGTGTEASKLEKFLYKIAGQEPPEIPRIEKKIGTIVRKPQILQSIVDAVYRIPTMYSIAEKLAYRAGQMEHPNDPVRAQETFERITKEIYSGELTKESEAILSKAAKEGAYHTFQSELGSLGSAFNAIRIRNPWTQLIVPFMNTWANLWKYGIRHTPLNVLTGQFRDAISKAFTGPKEVRELGQLSDELAAMTTGTMATMLATGTLGVLTGAVTGHGPDDKNEYDRLMATGWLPYSLKIGDKYISYKGYEPLSTWLGTMADVNEGVAREGAIGAIAGAMSNMVQNFISNPFLVGTTDLMDSLRGRKAPEEFLASLALGITIPTFMQQTARIIDPVVRETGDKDTPFFERFGASYAKRVPFLSESLESKLTPFGMEQRTDYPGTRLLALTISKDKQDAVINELNRLQTGVGFPSDIYKDFKLPPEVHRALIINSGQAIHKAVSDLISSPGYEQLDDEQKRKSINYIKNNIRDSVKEFMLEPRKDLLVEYFEKKRKRRKEARPDRELTKRILAQQQTYTGPVYEMEELQ